MTTLSPIRASANFSAFGFLLASLLGAPVAMAAEPASLGEVSVGDAASEETTSANGQAAAKDAQATAPAEEQGTVRWPWALLAYGIVSCTAAMAVVGVVGGLTVAGVNPLYQPNVDTTGENGTALARYQGLAGGLMTGFSAFGLIASFNSFVLVSVGMAGGYELGTKLLSE